MSRFAILLACLLALSCNARGHSGGGKLPPLERPAGPMDLEAARRYVLELVNRDREKEGLPPVERDEIAERGAQRHVEDMVRTGFTAHWGTDGSVPEQRYTEAGGVDFVQENAACFFDGTPRELDPNPTFTAVQLEKIETAFISEVPPNDGHRKNILKPVHNFLGVGLGKPLGVDQPCMAQEFVDRYGEYDAVPKTAKVGQNLRISGSVAAPVEFGGVGLSRIDPAQKRSAAELNATNVYPVPEPFVLFFPAGFKTPKPVQLDGNKFSIEAPLSDGGKPGRYGVSVWGKYPGADALVMISLRIVDVR
jgi:uncharacterized protein YkwD